METEERQEPAEAAPLSKMTLNNTGLLAVEVATSVLEEEEGKSGECQTSQMQVSCSWRVPILSSRPGVLRREPP